MTHLLEPHEADREVPLRDRLGYAPESSSDVVRVCILVRLHHGC